MSALAWTRCRRILETVARVSKFAERRVARCHTVSQAWNVSELRVAPGPTVYSENSSLCIRLSGVARRKATEGMEPGRFRPDHGCEHRKGEGEACAG